MKRSGDNGRKGFMMAMGFFDYEKEIQQEKFSFV